MSENENETPETETEEEPEIATDPEPEPEPEPGPETEEEPFETPADDVERMLARDKALDRELKRHEKVLANLHAEAWDSFTMCPLCEGDGFTKPRQPGELPEEQLAAIDALSGRFAPVEFKEDANYVACPNCDGGGHTSIPSERNPNLTKLCDVCSGNGYIVKSNVPQPPVVVPFPQSAPTTQALANPNYGSPDGPDQWGRYAGHPHYGIDPQFITTGAVGG